MNFTATVYEVLGPVLNEFAFTRQQEMSGRVAVVTYETAPLAVSVSYDALSHEVAVVFLFKESRAEHKTFELSELQAHLHQQPQFAKAVQIGTSEALHKYLHTVGEFLEAYLAYIVDNHTTLSAALHAAKTQQIHDYNEALQADFLKRDVTQLWKNKQYADIVARVKQYQGQLEGSLKKKYDYALKKMQE